MLKTIIKYPNYWEEAYEWACQRAREEGDVDIDHDYEIIEAWQEKHYEWICNDEGVEPYEQ